MAILKAFLIYSCNLIIIAITVIKIYSELYLQQKKILTAPQTKIKT